MRSYKRQLAERKAAILGLRQASDPVMDAPDDPRQIYVLGMILRYALVIGLCMCVTLVLTMAAQELSPGGYVSFLPAVCLLIAIDLLVLAPQLSKLPMLSKEWFLQNGARWVLIIAVLKLLTYVGGDGSKIVTDLPLMRTDPYRYFFSYPFAIMLCAVLLVWMMVRTLGFDLSQLTEGEKTMEVLPEAGMRTDRTIWRQSLCSHVLGFGAFNALIATGTFWLSQSKQHELSATWISIDLLFYFAIALALFGHTHLTILRTNWLWERTPIASNLVRRWTLYGLAFLAGLTLLALLLPVGSLDLLLPALNFLFQLLFYVAQLITFIVVGLAHLVLGLLMSLFGQSAPASQALPPPIPPFVPNVPVENIPLPAWYETMQTVIFFAILLIIAGYVLRYVILQHRGLREALARLPLVIWLREFWRGLQHVWRAAQQELVLWATPTTHSTPAIAEDAVIPITLTGMDDLSPREQVIALYQHTVQQAEQHGLPRPPSHTPNEFARALAKTLPDAAADVSTLTAQFSTARYSSQTVQAEQVSLVRRSMQQVVHWLRKHAGSKAS